MPAISHLLGLAPRAQSASRHIPFSSSGFSLDVSGFAGFLGGESAVSALATVHLVQGRRWCGWYNTPGAYEIAQRYGQLPNSWSWDRFFPGPKRPAAELFELEGQDGPAYVSLSSDSQPKLASTNHAAHLLASQVDGKEGCTTVTVVDLELDLPTKIQVKPLSRRLHAFFFPLPIAASLAACALCAFFRDGWCFSSIAQGIVTSGLTSAVIGIGHLEYRHPVLVDSGQQEHGVLIDRENSSILVLRGKKVAINALMLGRFVLKHKKEESQWWHFWIGICSVLLTLQFLTQLLLIPQGTLVGQILFVGSLVVSWVYNALGPTREDLQAKILLKILKLDKNNLRGYHLRNHTAGVIFACRILVGHRKFSDVAILRVLDELIPNDTEEGRRGKQDVVQMLQKGEEQWDASKISPQLEGSLGLDDEHSWAGLMRDVQEAYERWKTNDDRPCLALPPPSPSSQPSQLPSTSSAQHSRVTTLAHERQDTTSIMTEKDASTAR